jgi:hypothetical protein
MTASKKDNTKMYNCKIFIQKIWRFRALKGKGYWENSIKKLKIALVIPVKTGIQNTAF